jgi:hypothetical protein
MRHVSHEEAMRTTYGIFVENIKGRDHLENFLVEGRIILRENTNK